MGVLFYFIRGFPIFKGLRAAANSGAAQGAILNGNYIRAIEKSKKAIELEPDNWVYIAQHGEAYMRAKEYSLAITILEKSISQYKFDQLEYGSNSKASDVLEGRLNDVQNYLKYCLAQTDKI